MIMMVRARASALAVGIDRHNSYTLFLFSHLVQLNVSVQQEYIK